MKLTKVISGGQTGVDQAALFAARDALILTGGTAPKGFLTLNGKDPWLAGFGLEEGKGGYKDRTWMNVHNSDATLRIAKDFHSRGEHCTKNAIDRFKVPYLDIRWDGGLFTVEDVEKTVLWLYRGEYKTLNVAGNSEQTAPRIQEAAKGFLTHVFKSLRGKK